VEVIMNLAGIIPTNFISGVIPTVPISKSAVTNSIANGLIQNLATPIIGAGINVALGASTGAQATSFLGIPPSSFNNIAGSVLTPGLVRGGQEVLGNFLNDQLVNSGALGPFGPLVSGLAQGVVSNLAGNLLGGIFGGSFTNSNPNQWFPGAGNEPDADYGGRLYTPGPNGPDVVFSIKSAESAAVADNVSYWYGPDAPDLGVAAGLTSTQATNSPFSSGNLFSKPINNFDPTLYGAGTPESFNFYGDTLSKSGELGGLFSTVGLGSATSSLFTNNFLSWNFICAPDEISWNSEAQVERVQIFGTNQPPVISGSKSMRDLTLSNALVEGFCRKKTVEAKISELEALMNFSLDTSNSFVKVPVYKVTANSKQYGAGLDNKDGGYFVIKSVNVKETMRDIRGNTTRATVDVSFVQVPPYQVSTGRDIASEALRGQKSALGAVADKVDARLDTLGKAGLISAQTKQGTKSPAPSATSGSKTQPTNSQNRSTPYQGQDAGNPEAAKPTR